MLWDKEYIEAEADPVAEKASELTVIKSLLNVSKILFLDKGTMMYEDGMKVENLYLVLQGTAEAYFVENGKHRTITQFDAGTILGLNALLKAEKHASIFCKTPCVVATIPVSFLRKADPEILLNLIRFQNQKSRGITENIYDIAFHTGEQRFLRYLLRKAAKEATYIYKRIPVYISFSEQETADVICTTKKYIHTLLKKLEEQTELSVGKDYLLFFPDKIQRLLEIISSDTDE